MAIHVGSLSAPGEAIADPQSVEMIRAWVANRGLHCSLRIGMWEQTPGVREDHAWGILLADVVKHVADALAALGKDRGAMIAAIRQSFLAELDTPTSSTAGDFTEGPSRN